MVRISSDHLLSLGVKLTILMDYWMSIASRSLHGSNQERGKHRGVTFIGLSGNG